MCAADKDHLVRSIIHEAEKFARTELENDATGHDWWHVHRVVRMAERLAEEEGADRFICAVSALLHDVADEKLNDSKESGMQKVRSWLAAQPIAEEDQAHILEIIATMSYNAGTNPPMRTLEGQVVQDADRLDAIGAIAIARTFVYAGFKGSPIHNPAIQPRDAMTAKEYRDHSNNTALNHFYEKLFKLKDLINTSAARQIAEQRHQYMVQYVQQFLSEWEGIQ